MAAVLAADMAGFSRLMEADEVGTVARQKHIFDTIVIPIIEAGRGRIVKHTGDGFLAEFQSVVDAVACAVDTQRKVAALETGAQASQTIRYRMAVNLGDIILDGDDIAGDGVNIAARLEALAEPGGIVVSGTAYDHLKANVDVSYEDLGERQLKNIATPVRVYRVVDGSGAVRIAPRWRRLVLPWVAAAALVLVGAVAAWWSFSHSRGPSGVQSIAELRALPGVAVLPFENLSPDPEQSYFATGLTEELTARLAHFNNIRVIARNSASQFGDGARDLREISDVLGARYLIEGSVRRDAQRIRVTAQLIDGETAEHLWNSNYDETLSARAIIDIQDQIAGAVASNVGGLGGAIRKTSTVPVSQRPDDIDAYDCVLLHYKFWDTFDHSVHARARDCLESAVERHPDFAFGWAELAYTYWTEHAYGVNTLPNSLERAKHAAETSIQLDPQLAEGHGALSQTFRSMQMANEAAAAAERAFAINPNNVGILGGAGCMLTFTGRLERAEVFLNRALTLDPLPPWWIPYCKSLWYLQRDNPDGALALLDAHAGPNIWLLGFARIVSLVEAGRDDEAIGLRSRLLEQHPDLDQKTVSYLKKNFWAQPDVEARLVAALQTAGMPPT